MAGSDLFKPCDELTPEDFERHPVWGFDLAMEGHHEDADETWVRPYKYRAVPKRSDVLFLRATMNGKPATVCARFERGKLTFEGAARLVPRYEFEPEPTDYRAEVTIGGKRFVLTDARSKR